MCGLMFAHVLGWEFVCGLAPALAHDDLDIGNFKSGFVVPHSGASGGVVNRSACNPRHIANPLFYFVHGQHRQYVAHFNDARSHRTFSKGVMGRPLYSGHSDP